MTRTLERQLIEAFSLRAVETAASRRTALILHADRYYGSGMNDHRGSGRSGILLSKNVFLKGVGRTPLAGFGHPRHRHGELQLVHAIAETLYSELAAHLFSAGAARVVAILDQWRTERVEGRVRRLAVIARVGAPFRPAHLIRRLNDDLTDLPALFVRLARHGGLLVTRTGRPHFADTMRRILRLHARTAAEQVRWRVMHGTLSTSNMGLFGEMLDVWLMTTQDRTAPLHVTRRRYRDTVFGREHLSRAMNLHAMFVSATEALTPTQRKYFGAVGLDCHAEFNKYYEEELAIQLLNCTGLHTHVARQLLSTNRLLVERYVRVIKRLMALRNPGCLDARVTTGRRIGVVDVFRVLSRLPTWYLRPPHVDHTSQVRRLARIQVFGPAVRRRRNHGLANKHLNELVRLYREVMTAAHLLDERELRTSHATCDAICSRAERGYVSLTGYRRAYLLPRISALVREYSAHGKRFPRAVQQFIDVVLANAPRAQEHDEDGGSVSG